MELVFVWKKKDPAVILQVCKEPSLETPPVSWGESRQLWEETQKMLDQVLEVSAPVESANRKICSKEQDSVVCGI